MSRELYSYNTYKGYDLFVELIDSHLGPRYYAGVARRDGRTACESMSYTSGDLAEQKLKEQIDEQS